MFTWVRIEQQYPAVLSMLAMFSVYLGKDRAAIPRSPVSVGDVSVFTWVRIEQPQEQRCPILSVFATF